MVVVIVVALVIVATAVLDMNGDVELMPSQNPSIKKSLSHAGSSMLTSTTRLALLHCANSRTDS